MAIFCKIAKLKTRQYLVSMTNKYIILSHMLTCSILTVVFNNYRYRFRPRVLRDVSRLDTRVQLFGEWVEFPICVAPTAMQKMAHHQGELATARGEC